MVPYLVDKRRRGGSIGACQYFDISQAITFYSTPFNTAPAKVKPGYANFAVTPTGTCCAADAPPKE
jgi:hypothetical protein